MLGSWKNMHPEQHYFQKHIDLCEHAGDPAYLAKEEAFERSYENPIDLPGRWYLQVITQLFKENRLAKGEFVGLGRKLNLGDITCPTYHLAGAADDVTPPSMPSTQPNISGRRSTRSSRRPYREDISASS